MSQAWTPGPPPPGPTRPIQGDSSPTAGPGIQTLPIWILTNLFRPGQGPLVAVVAAFLVLVSVGPIYLAQHLSRTDR